MKKKIVKLLKRKEFYFVVIVYPFFFYTIMKVKENLQGWIKEYDNFNYYGTVSLLFIFVMILLVVLEGTMKLYGYGIQGDKLKIRAREGLNLEDINNDGKRQK